jgi:hypothetical protein
MRPPCHGAAGGRRDDATASLRLDTLRSRRPEGVAVPSSDASATIEIAADPGRVYALITDLDVLGELADEATSMRWTRGATTARVGATFRGANRNGLRRWSTSCTVAAADPGRCFAFEVTFPPALRVARWQYDLAPTDAGCVVTESTFDRRATWFASLSGIATGERDRGAANRAHITATLRRLKERAEA